MSERIPTSQKVAVAMLIFAGFVALGAIVLVIVSLVNAFFS